MIEIECNQISVINRYIATACSASITVAFLEIPHVNKSFKLNFPKAQYIVYFNIENRAHFSLITDDMNSRTLYQTPYGKYSHRMLLSPVNAINFAHQYNTFCAYSSQILGSNSNVECVPTNRVQTVKCHLIPVQQHKRSSGCR